MKHYSRPFNLLSVISVAGIALSACSPASDQHIDMCQKITQNLVGAVSEWKEPIKSEGRKFASVELAYSTSDGMTGNAVCQHPYQQDETYRIAPASMLLNGVEVTQKDLMSASFGATKQAVKETADHTKEKSVQLAQDASVKAKEMADQAQVMAAEAKVKAEELSVKAEALAGEAKAKAAVLAQEASVKAAELAAQASEFSAVAKEKAREAAVAAAKTVQDKLEN